MAGYGGLAPFYDGFFEKEYSDKTVIRYLHILSPRGIAGKRILDLGCGTGRLSLPLARRGARVTALDPDDAMLSQAKTQAAAENLGIDFFCGTLPEYAGEGGFDAIVSSLDVINHITAPRQLELTFAAARAVLRPGGLFVFDVNTEKKFEKVYADNAYVFKNERAVCSWENSYDARTGLCRFTLEVFEREGETYRRRTDLIYERYYSDVRLRELLSRAGFGKVLRRNVDSGTRSIYIAE